VWRAHDVQLDRSVAVKRLHPHLLPDAASRERLVAEARAAARLGHPAIVGIYDVDATGESAAIVMELVEGESLAARIDREGPLAEREAVGITADVADALFHAHRQGVVHRDVKPGNVLLGTDGRTRLVDFGIAHSLAASTERLTQAGSVIGTLRAMAPEQLAGGPITPRTDLYGLGAVLHESLTARPPYPALTPVALADAQRAGPPSLDGLDPVLGGLIAACLAYDPAARPLHAGALAAALRSWLDGDTSAGLALASALPVGHDTSEVTRPVAVVAPTEPPSDPAPPRARRGPWPAAAILAAGLLGAVAVVAGVIALSGPGDGNVPVDQATPSATQTSVPSPTLAERPEWFAGLLEDIAQDCSQGRVNRAERDMAAMTEDQAEEYAEAVIEECKDRGGGNDD
jgi:eukaryotic-like serine/threonine-protein kinase